MHINMKKIRLEFIKQKINYLGRKESGENSNELIDDFLWLIDKVEKEIKKIILAAVNMNYLKNGL